MSEMPDDVMTAAVGVKTLLRFTPETEWGSIIARAILAERHRCADVATREREAWYDNDGELLGPDVAAAILAGAPA